MALPFVYSNEDLFEQLEQLTKDSGQDSELSNEASPQSQASQSVQSNWQSTPMTTSNKSGNLSQLLLSTWTDFDGADSDRKFSTQFSEIQTPNDQHHETFNSNVSDTYFLGQNFTRIAAVSMNDTLSSPKIHRSFDLSSTIIDKQLLRPVDYNKTDIWLRMAKRMWLISDNIVNYLETSFNETIATSIASITILIVAISIISCFIYNLLREEERTIKQDKYHRLHVGGLNQQSVDKSIIKSTTMSRPLTTTTVNIPTSRLCRRTSAFMAGGSSTNNTTARNDCRLVIHEMRRETYFGLVRLLKPGCRTILLLCDSKSRAKLLPKYYSCVYPYRRNKALMFAFLLIEKNIDWYKALLKQALNDYRELHINPKNCIGTVLSLSGFKKYFCVYHTIKQDTGYYGQDTSDGGTFQDEVGVVLEDNLLDELPRWLERLFAGKTSRYHVKYWPEHMR